ncbi:MAG: A/G-specific adenine glycosylase [Candidatus Paceibacterota bacterium]
MKRIQAQIFQQKIWKYYKKHKRAMMWRTPVLKLQKNDTLDPYKILISEIMLQQTQVSRVSEIFPHFIKQFPSFVSLARASREKVLIAWQGLGYNRRALYVHQSAQEIVKKYKGIVPHNQSVLQTLPGIGANTAASICAFAFNQPVVFIETNIRSVFIHHFFKDVAKVSDNEIRELVEKTLDIKNPREWYWALMDYGSMLKKQGKNPSKKSKHYVIQKKFKDSNRELRGNILKILLRGKKKMSQVDLAQELHKTVEELRKPLMQLCIEGFIQHKGRYYGIR